MERPGLSSTTVTTFLGSQLISQPVYATNLSPRLTFLSPPAQFSLPAVVLQQNMLRPQLCLPSDNAVLSANTRLLLTAAVQQPMVPTADHPTTVINQSHPSLVTQVVAKQMPVPIDISNAVLKAESSPAHRIAANCSPVERSTVFQQHSVASLKNVNSSPRPSSNNQFQTMGSSSVGTVASSSRLCVPQYSQMAPCLVTCSVSSGRQLSSSQPASPIILGSQRYILGGHTQPLQLRTVPQVLARAPSATAITVPQVAARVPSATAITVSQLAARVPSATAITVPQVAARVSSATAITVSQLAARVPSATAITVSQLAARVPSATAITVPQLAARVPSATAITVPQVAARTPLANSIAVPQVSVRASLANSIAVSPARIPLPNSIANPQVPARTPTVMASPNLQVSAHMPLISPPACSNTPNVTVFEAYNLVNSLTCRPEPNRLSSPNSPLYFSTSVRPSMYARRPIATTSVNHSLGHSQLSNKLSTVSTSYVLPASISTASSVIGVLALSSKAGGTGRSSMESAATVSGIGIMSANQESVRSTLVNSSVIEQDPQTIGYTAMLPTSMIENILQKLCSSATAVQSGMNVTFRSVVPSVSRATFVTECMPSNIASVAGEVYQAGAQPLTLLGNTAMTVNHLGTCHNTPMLNTSSGTIYRAGAIPTNCQPSCTVQIAQAGRGVRNTSRPLLKRTYTHRTMTRQQLALSNIQREHVLSEATKQRFGRAVTLVRPPVLMNVNQGMRNNLAMRHPLLYQHTTPVIPSTSATNSLTMAQICTEGTQPIVAGLKRKFVFGKRYNFNLNQGKCSAYFNGTSFQMKKPATEDNIYSRSKVNPAWSQFHVAEKQSMETQSTQVSSEAEPMETQALHSQSLRYYCARCSLVDKNSQCFKCGRPMPIFGDRKSTVDDSAGHLPKLPARKSAAKIQRITSHELSLPSKAVARTMLTKKTLKNKITQSKRVEPEVVQILSSDDDDCESMSKAASTTNSVVSSASQVITQGDTSVPESVQSQPLVVVCKSDPGTTTSLTQPPVSMKVRFVRIGTMPLARVVDCLFFVQALRISFIPEGSSGVTHLPLLCTDIKFMRVHFGPSGPVIFLLMTAEFGKKIRSLLGMANHPNFFYDPDSVEDCLKYVLIVPQQSYVTESEMEAVVRRMQSQPSAKFDYECLQPTVASNLLISILKTPPPPVSVPSVVPISMSQTMLMTSTSQIRLVLPSAFTRFTCITNGDEDEEMADRSRSPSPPHPIFSGPVVKLFIYPPAPATGGITVTNEDLYCLNDGEFLNDVIIDFYLKYVQLELLSSENRLRTHIFSSFFYRRLTQKQPRGNMNEDTANMTLPQRRHLRVKTWTRNVDLFAKDFVIVPINESAHWYLAIICFPGVLQPTPMETSGTSDSANTSECSVEQQLGKESIRKLSPPIKQPCILVFDSLMGIPQHLGVIRTLREYMQEEWNARKCAVSGPRAFTKESFKGTSVRCPQQTNFSDCGIYVLQYVESFFTQPIRNYTFPLLSLLTWFTEELILTKRESLRQLVLSLQRRLNPELQYDPKQDGMQISSVSSCPTVESMDSDTSASIPLIALETESTSATVVDTVMSDTNGKEAASSIHLMSAPVYNDSKSGIVAAPVTLKTGIAVNEPIPVMVVDPMSSDTTPVCNDSISVMVVDPMLSDSRPSCDESTSVKVAEPMIIDSSCFESISVMVADPMLSDSRPGCDDSTSVMVAEAMLSDSRPVCEEPTSVIVTETILYDSRPVCEEPTTVIVTETMLSDSRLVCEEPTSVIVTEPTLSDSRPVCDALEYAMVAKQVSVNNFPSTLVICEPSVTISARSMSVCESVKLCSEESSDAKRTESSETDTVAVIDAFVSVQSSDLCEIKSHETGTSCAIEPDISNHCAIEPDISNHSLVQITNDAAVHVRDATSTNERFIKLMSDESSAIFSTIECDESEVAEQTSITVYLPGGVNIPLEPLSDVSPTPPGDLLLQQLNLSSDSIRLSSEAVSDAICVQETSSVLPLDAVNEASCVQQTSTALPLELDLCSATFVGGGKEPIPDALGDTFSYAVSESKDDLLDAVNMNCVTSTSLLVVNHVDPLSNDVRNEQQMDAEDLSCR